MNEKMINAIGVVWLLLAVFTAIVLSMSEQQVPRAKTTSPRSPTSFLRRSLAPSPSVVEADGSAVATVEVSGSGPSSARTSVTVKD